MTQTPEERIAALESLLPLLEAHLDRHGSIVSRAQWISPPDPHAPGWVPPPPEPECMAPCWLCHDFKTTRCTLREERWASEWITLRQGYPQLKSLEVMVRKDLAYEHANWASALYWVHVQPWDMWNVERRQEWANRGVEWLSDCWAHRRLGWLPTYVPPDMPEPDPEGDLKRLIVALRYQRDLSHHAIGRIVGCHKSYVGKVLAALKGR